MVDSLEDMGIDGRFTKEGLPFLTFEAIKSFWELLMENTRTGEEKSRFYDGLINEISEKNPKVLRFITTLVNHIAPEQGLNVFESMLDLYKLLQMQAEQYKANVQ